MLINSSIIASINSQVEIIDLFNDIIKSSRKHCFDESNIFLQLNWEISCVKNWPIKYEQKFMNSL